MPEPAKLSGVGDRIAEFTNDDVVTDRITSAFAALIRLITTAVERNSMLRSDARLTLKRTAVAGTGAAALLLLCATGALAGNTTPKSARPVAGGYYVGTTAQHKSGTADVSPNGKQVSAAQFTLSCAGKTLTAAMQNMKIKKSAGKFRFSGSGEEALLFMPSYLSELGQVSVSGKFVAHHKIKGVFRVTSPSCPDSGKIAYTLKLKTH